MRGLDWVTPHTRSINCVGMPLAEALPSSYSDGSCYMHNESWRETESVRCTCAMLRLPDEIAALLRCALYRKSLQGTMPKCVRPPT
jgi:hypothetical protein